MRQSAVSPTASATAPHMAEDVDRICRLFDATAVAPPAHQQCEREVLVGGELGQRLRIHLGCRRRCATLMSFFKEVT